MKKLLSILLIFSCCSALSFKTYGFDLVSGAKVTKLGLEIEPNDSIILTNDPQFEWSQFKNKQCSAMVTSTGLQLENKMKASAFNNSNTTIVSSTVDLDFSPETDNFVFGTCFFGPKLSEDTGIGVIFDYEDERNYKGVMITDTQFNYFTVKDGVSASVKTGLIKINTKNQMYNFRLERNGDKMTFTLNDIEYAKFNRIKISSSCFGVFLTGKGKTAIPYFMFRIIQPDGDTEESTSNT